MPKAPQPPVDPALVAYWADLAQRLDGARNGSRAALIEGAMAAHGLGSADAVYRRLRQYGGWQSGRAKRKDAGAQAIPDDTLKTIAGIYREGARQDGRRIMSLDLAVSIAEQSGHQVPVTVSQVGRYLRAQRMDAGSQANAEHFSELRSLHPNHVHEVDPSLCVLYYLAGRQHIIREADFYKNKLDRVAKIQTKCWRYLLTDHYSGAPLVRYYVQAGESQAAMFDFLLWAWTRQPGRVMHGLPKIVLWDKGSANIAHGIQTLLEALDIRAIEHSTERSNVKGQVESSQRIVERGFESRLRFEPVADVDQLNAAADLWSAAFNANLLPRLDTRIHRPGAAPLVRTDLWLHIRADQIRECPPREVCARVLEGRPETRIVRPQAYITYPHPALGRATKYSLRTVTELHRGDQVTVSPLLVGLDGEQGFIRLRWKDPQGQDHTWRVAPEVELDRAGRPMAAAVIGETYCPPTKRDAQRAADSLDALAYPRTEQEISAQREAGKEIDDHEHARRSRQKNVVPFGGTLNAIGHLADIQQPTYLPRRGTAVELEAPEDRTPDVPLVRALSRLRDAWGRPITREESAWLRTRYGAQIPETELQRLAAAPDSSTPSNVTAIGGHPK
jgi:hypothetical protein